MPKFLFPQRFSFRFHSIAPSTAGVLGCGVLGCGVLGCGVLGCAVLLSGCALAPSELKKIRPPSLPQSKVPELKPGELPTITVIPAGNESYWNQARRGAEAAGKQFGARIVWKVPSGDLIKSQKKLVENVSKTSQGLVLAPADSTKLMQPVGDAARAGVSVVAFDRDVFTIQNKMSFVHNDDEASGVLAARTAAKIYSSGSVTTVGVEPQFAVQERRGAFDETIKKESASMEVMKRDEPYAGSPAWVFSADKTSSRGIANQPALKLPAGIPQPKYILFGFDESLYRSLGRKDVVALISPDYYQMAFQSVQAILNFRATKQMPPREIKIAPRVLTKDTKPTKTTTNRSTP